MEKRFRLAAAALVFALLAQPVAVIAECVSMPAKECSSSEAQDMHCPQPARLQAQDRSACCEVQSAPAAPSKTPAAAGELTAAVVVVKASGITAAPAASLHGSVYHDPPRLLDTSQTQALLGVFLI